MAGSKVQRWNQGYWFMLGKFNFAKGSGFLPGYITDIIRKRDFEKVPSNMLRFFRSLNKGVLRILDKLFQSLKANSQWRLYAVFLGVFGLAELIAMWFFPEYQTLVWFCFYSAISNFFITFLPHEPIILLYGTLFSPWVVAFWGAASVCWVEFFNYKFLTRITNIKRVQYITGKQWYQKAENWFMKAPFSSLVFAGLTPVPFAIFRILAVTSRYPMLRFLISVLVGRAPRYYILALTSAVINLPWWVYGIFFLLLLVFALWKQIAVKFERRQK